MCGVASSLRDCYQKTKSTMKALSLYGHPAPFRLFALPEEGPTKSVDQTHLPGVGRWPNQDRSLSLYLPLVLNAFMGPALEISWKIDRQLLCPVRKMEVGERGMNEELRCVCCVRCPLWRPNNRRRKRAKVFAKIFWKRRKEEREKKGKKEKGGSFTVWVVLFLGIYRELVGGVW